MLQSTTDSIVGRVLTILSVVLLLNTTAFAAPASPPRDPRGPGTIRMARRLQEIADSVNVMNNPYQNARRAEVLRPLVGAEKDPKRRSDLMRSFANELLDSGRNMEALQQYQRWEQSLTQTDPESFRRDRWNAKGNQALSWLRMGEWTNCVTDHNAESCLAPIAGRGVHRLQDGSRRAIQILEEMLQELPDNLMARWLLNIACMTVGDYPDKVPARWLVPPSAFASEYDIKRFPNVAGLVGLDDMRLSGGSVLEDFDGDGNLDVMFSSIGLRDQMRYFRNNGDGSFIEKTAEAGLIGEVGGLNLIQSDFNNDGWPDVLVLRGAWMRSEGKFPKSLLRNNGDGTFEDVTETAGLLSFQSSQTAAWFDYDNDGWIDLFFGNESLRRDGNRCELFRNNGDGTFTECAAASGVAYAGYVKGVGSGDFNSDGRPDLYLSVLGAANVLFRNDGPISTNAGQAIWKFTNIAPHAGVTEPIDSFPCWFFDYDNDGWDDLYVGGYKAQGVGDVCADYLGLPHQAERPRLYRNNRDGTFKDMTKEAGLFRVLLAMGSNFGDLDNDGYLDFYLGTGNPDLATVIPNRMFRNDRGTRFQDVTTSGGFGHLQKGHGISFGDIDNDGDQDVYEDMGGAVSGDVAHNVLYQNAGHGNHWITLKLEGARSNRAAVGARIRVVVKTSSGEGAYFKTVGTGGSFGASPLRQEIGLGQAQAISRVEIFWPATGKTQVLSGLEMDRFYKIKEDEAQAVRVDLKTFKLGAKGAAPHAHEHHR
ncbi:MAG: CRTAC1 family protein [Verrucomicrobiales bacterium]|nr:CRTAC1 family protein [Verrucomicrobiales bacterium]